MCNMMQSGASWALSPPKTCPRCKGRVRAFFINFELDKVGCAKISGIMSLQPCYLQVVMCENVSCDWPFRLGDLAGGCIIVGKVF